jgi:hypothetical protein
MSNPSPEAEAVIIMGLGGRRWVIVRQSVTQGHSEFRCEDAAGGCGVDPCTPHRAVAKCHSLKTFRTLREAREYAVLYARAPGASALADRAIIVRATQRRWLVVYHYMEYGTDRDEYWCVDDNNGGWATGATAELAVSVCAYPKTYRSRRAARAAAELYVDTVIG